MKKHNKDYLCLASAMLVILSLSAAYYGDGYFAGWFLVGASLVVGFLLLSGE